VAIPVSSAPADEASWKIPLHVIHSTDDDVLPIDPVRAHVALLKARGARIEFRELSKLSHYNTGSFVPALRDASSWLAGLWGMSGSPATR
jgi:predicted esterase